MATATPLDVPERSKPRARGRLQLILILLVVLGPMILATSMYKLKFWVPEGRSYHGEMIGNGESRADLGVAGQDERWQLLVSAPPPVPTIASAWCTWPGRSRWAWAVTPAVPAMRWPARSR